MLQIVKRIVAKKDAYIESEKKRGNNGEYIDKIISCHDYTRVITTNIDTLNTLKNKLSSFFKHINTKSCSLEVPSSVINDIMIVDKNEPINFNKYYDMTDTITVAIPDKQYLTYMALSIKRLTDVLSEELKGNNCKMYEMAGYIGNLLSPHVPDTDAETFYVYDNKTGIDYNHDICHSDIMELLGLKWGPAVSQIAGNRAYVLTQHIFMLKHALMNYTIDFASKKGYSMMNVPVFMNHDSMQKVCQLSDFEETLYEISDKSKKDDTSKFYLTATSEQFLVAYHSNKKLNKNDLPLKYCAHNECFRKETGRHGKDTSGIFRIHQFDKFEQFIVCDPNESHTELHKLLEIIKEFYESLGLSFKIIAMDARDLNQSTSIKYDLEAYFPYSKSYKELVSCSNCTDYQAIKVDCKAGNNYVHMLNCTLCAVQRTLCCICETYWDNNNRTLTIPEVLKPFMNTKENYLPPI